MKDKYSSLVKKAILPLTGLVLLASSLGLSGCKTLETFEPRRYYFSLDNLSNPHYQGQLQDKYYRDGGAGAGGESGHGGGPSGGDGDAGAAGK